MFFKLLFPFHTERLLNLTPNLGHHLLHVRTIIAEGQSGGLRPIKPSKSSTCGISRSNRRASCSERRDSARAARAATAATICWTSSLSALPPSKALLSAASSRAFSCWRRTCSASSRAFCCSALPAWTLIHPNLYRRVAPRRHPPHPPRPTDSSTVLPSS